MDIPIFFSARCETKSLLNETDEPLIARARAGDDCAFGEIFELHSRFVYKFVYAMLGGSRSAAEELTQETFLAAYKSIGSLRGEASLRTWLCAIAKNVVYKSLRAERKEAGKCDAELESLKVADAKNQPPDEAILSRELNGRIHSALARLDADKRLVFTLRELQNLSYREISEITGANVAKLKTDLHRAKIEMRRTLKPYLEAKR